MTNMNHCNTVFWTEKVSFVKVHLAFWRFKENSLEWEYT